MKQTYGVTPIDGEQWRPLHGHEGLYEISNMGRVKALKRTIVCADGEVRTYREKLLCQKQHYGGPYLFSTASKNGKRFSFSVAKEVVRAFSENPENRPWVNHKNGIKTDNRSDNLEWATPKENTAHAVFRLQRNVREKNYCHKLTDEKVMLAKQLYASGKENYVSLGRMFGTSHVAVRNAIVGKTWRTLNG